MALCEGCSQIVYMTTGFRKRFQCSDCGARIIPGEPWDSLVSSARLRWRSLKGDEHSVDADTGESPPPTAVPAAGHVFVSYSHEDQEFHDDLMVVLKPYLQSGSITAWSDEQIRPGSNWMNEIRAALSKARVALFLVSKNFLASDFIRDKELGPLLEEASDGGVTILWVRIGACGHSESPLSEYQAIVSPPGPPLANLQPAERDEAWVDVCDVVKSIMQT